MMTLFRQRDALFNLQASEGMETFAKNVSQKIVPKIEPPYAVALNGSWGSGKTTALMLIRNALRDARYHYVWFNTWEYDGVDDVCWALLKNIFLQLHKQNLVDLSEVETIVRKFAYGFSGALSKLVGGKLISLVDLRDLFQKAEEDTLKPVEAFKDQVQELKKEYISLVNNALKKQNNEDQQLPLVVFLDDLDRCHPEEALALVDSLKNMFCAKMTSGEVPQVIFMAAFDAQVLKTAIGRKFTDMPDTGTTNPRSLSDEYFRKVFNITLAVPRLEKEEYESITLEYANMILSEVDTTRRNNYVKTLQELCKETKHFRLRHIIAILEKVAVFELMEDCAASNSSEILAFLFLSEWFPKEWEVIRAEADKENTGIGSRIKVHLEDCNIGSEIMKHIDMDPSKSDSLGNLLRRIRLCF